LDHLPLRHERINLRNGLMRCPHEQLSKIVTKTSSECSTNEIPF
jgi:hypothetical protein